MKGYHSPNQICRSDTLGTPQMTHPQNQIILALTKIMKGFQSKI